jgi:hypothetical protein
MIKEEYKGSRVYSKRLRCMIEVCDANIDVLLAEPRLALYLNRTPTKITVKDVSDKKKSTQQVSGNGNGTRKRRKQ